MIILYIPFERSNCGNLNEGAQIWQSNYALSSPEKIKIIYYKDDFDIEEIDPHSKLYILAHGYTNNPNILANHSNINLASAISIETLASRFNYDFSGLIHCFHSIHLYCCGNLNKNQLIAKNFYQSIIKSEDTRIYYYQGTLSVVNQLGQFWTQQNNRLMLATPLKLIESDSKPEIPIFARLPYKMNTRPTHQEFQEKSRAYTANKRKETRFKFFQDLRNERVTLARTMDIDKALSNSNLAQAYSQK
ncbi:hypothetical protein ACNVED_00365 [Legionella sp. D16C41]|uniref:hypothetical protein n=1 Tax=Legionella sp. D16C41 TaxID=3402688 RepID=UPI003AF56DFC